MKGLIEKIEKSHDKKPWFHFDSLAAWYFIPIPITRQGWASILITASFVVGWLYFARPLMISSQILYSALFIIAPAAVLIAFVILFVIKSDLNK